MVRNNQRPGCRQRHPSALVRRLSQLPVRCLPAALALLLGFGNSAGAEALDLDALKRMSLEDLVAVEVTIATKTPKRLSDVAAAVFVITAEDIAGSGATSLPEVLRMVPGIQVGRVDNRNWAVGIRGFNGRFSNKLLVQIDGRSVYTPQFSGVFWDAHNLMLTDIDRIEVIRGPGATLWGANAVNGIINVITKTSADTQGTLVEVGAGHVERAFGAVRHGGRLGEVGSYRAYLKYRDRDSPFEDVEDDDDWEMGQAGFRADWSAASSRFVLQGDVYDSTIASAQTELSLNPPFERLGIGTTTFSGGNLLFRWTREATAAGRTSFQAYYDQADRSEFLFADLWAENLGLDWQQELVLADHQLVWGLGFRLTETSGTLSQNGTRRDRLWSAFAQDEIALVDGRLRLTYGTKIEHNDYTGWEVQPSVRALWKTGANGSLWAAASRAVRTPSRLEAEIALDNRIVEPFSAANPSPYPVLLTLSGNPEFEAERAVSLEFGGRRIFGDDLSIDVAAFYTRYRDLRSLELSPPEFVAGPDLPPHVLVAAVPTNRLRGASRGVELALNWQARSWWQLRSGLSLLDVDIDDQPASTDPTAQDPEGQSPASQLSVRSSMKFEHSLTLDLWLRYSGALPSVVSGVRLPAYTTLDGRLSWRPRRDFEVALIGKDLIGSHAEFRSEIIRAPQETEIGRNVYVQFEWRF